MRLLYSAGSRFGRLVRIARLETGFAAPVTKQELPRTRLY